MPHRALATAAAVLTVVGLLLALRGGADGSGSAAPRRTPISRATTTTVSPLADLPVLTVSAAELHEPGGVAPLPPHVHDAVRDVVVRYLAAGVVAPLRTGAVGPGLDHVVTDAVRGRLAGPDRLALVDEGLPPSTRVTVDRAEARLTALAAADGGIAVVVATVEIDASGDGDGTPTVQRRGDLVLVPGGPGGWLLDGYAVTVTRSAGETTTSASAELGTGP